MYNCYVEYFKQNTIDPANQILTALVPQLGVICNYLPMQTGLQQTLPTKKDRHQGLPDQT
jgi:hypothetical protein